MELSDLVFDPLHFVIHIDHSAGAVQQFIADILITVHFFDILLVTQLMLQSCPEIHTVGTDLDLCTHGSFSLGEEYGDFHDHVITAVAVWLWIFDIVLYLDDGNVILPGDQVCNSVDIIDKGTDNTDACHVIQLILNILRSKLIAELFELFVNAFRLLILVLMKEIGLRLYSNENSSLRTSSLVRTSRTVHRYIIIRSLNFAEFLIKTCGSGVSSQVFVFLSAIVFFW